MAALVSAHELGFASEADAKMEHDLPRKAMAAGAGAPAQIASWERDAKMEHDLPSKAMVAGVGAPPQERILFYGNLCLDHVLDVTSYPKEDTGSRALGSRKALGGNGANSTRVLKQLRGAGSTVSWLGPVPRANEPDTTFALDTLHSHGVDTSLLEEVGGDGLPSSFILTSRESGSRTIVSTRNGCRELSTEHFKAAIGRAFEDGARFGRPRWCHLECRQPPEVTTKLAEAWQAATAGQDVKLSVEIEKPSMTPAGIATLMSSCDVAFFSQEWVEAHHDELAGGAPSEKKRRVQDGVEEDHPAPRCLRGLRARVQHAAGGVAEGLWICGWGSTGAFALDAKTGALYFEPSVKVAKVVDSVGAGDTFVAANIHALASGAAPQAALRCSCAVAGRKVSQVGFDMLKDALPADSA